MADPATPTPAAPTPAATPAATPERPTSLGADIAAAPAAAPVDPAAAKPAEPPAAFHPEGLPEQLRGKTDRETIEKLWKAESERAKPPAAAADYKLELPAELTKFIDPANDAVLPLFREVAQKHGLTQAQYQGAIVDLHTAMAKAGMLQPLVDVGAEYAALGAGQPDKASQIAKGKERAAHVRDGINALATKQVLAADEAKDLLGNLVSAKTFAAVEKILALLPQETGLRPGQRPGGGPPSQDQLLAAMYPSMAPQPNGAAR